MKTTQKKTLKPNRIARITRPDGTIVTFNPGSDVTWIGEDEGSCEHGTVVSISEAGAEVKPTAKDRTVTLAFYKLGVPEGETYDATAGVELSTIYPPAKQKRATRKISTKKIEKRFAEIRQRLSERAGMIASDRQMHERDLEGPYKANIAGRIDQILAHAVDAVHHLTMIDLATHSYASQQADLTSLAATLPDPVTLDDTVGCLATLTAHLCNAIGTLDLGLGTFHTLERPDDAAIAGRPPTAHGDVFKVLEKMTGEAKHLSDIANGKTRATQTV